MKYWERWIGDWKRKTAHLSAEAKGIYGELLDHEYATHRPLPADHEDIYRLAGAVTASERKATDKVLAEFYTCTDEGYANKRAQEEIARRTQYVEAQRERANRRWHAEPQQPEQEETPTPKEKRINGAPIDLPEWIAADTFRAWIKIRPAKARTQDAQRAAIAKLEKFRAQGLDPNAIVSESLANGWQGIFNPERSKGARGRSAQTLQGSFGRCKYCERSATRRTNGIAHCEEPRHLDNAIQGA